MKNNKLFAKISRTLGKTGLKLKKHSPEILVVTGIVGAVASTVLACKETTKLDSVLDGSKRKIEQIHNSAEAGQVVGADTIVEYSKEDEKKDLTITYIQTGAKIAKLYAPAAILGALSITSILAGHSILRKRNVAAMAACAAAIKEFKDYRNRVVERFDEQTDMELLHNIKTEKVVEMTTDEDGNEKPIEKTIVTADNNKEFTAIFDETSLAFDREYEDANDFFLLNEQNYANDKLKANGYIFLNDIRDRLGLPRTPAGQVLGWLYDPENPKGDNYVDFGIKKLNDSIDGAPSPSAYFLNFNADGVVYNLI